MKILNYKRHGLPAGAVYIGRAMKRYNLPESPLANPFKLTAWTRWGVLEAYESFLYWAIAHVERADCAGIVAALDELTEDSVLVCWCKTPGKEVDCHGDVIERVWRERQAGGAGAREREGE